MTRRRRKREQDSDDDDDELDIASSYKSSVRGKGKCDSSVASGKSKGYSQTTDEFDDTSEDDAPEGLLNVYRMVCGSEGIPPNPTVTSLLTDVDHYRERHPKQGASLDLSRHYIGHTHLCILADVLHTTGCPLSTVSLKGNRLHYTALPSFIAAFKSRRSRVTHIDLSDNPTLGYLSGREVLSLVRTKQRITAVGLEGTAIHSSLRAKIDAQLAANKRYVDMGAPHIATEVSLAYYMPRTFLSVYYPPILVSFSSVDAAYVAQLCTALSAYDPRLNGAFALFHYRKTSPDYHEFIKTCFVDADYVLIVASKAWCEDKQCNAEVTWFHGRTTFIVTPELLELSTFTLADREVSASECGAEVVDEMDATIEKLALFQTVSSSYVLPPSGSMLPCLRCAPGAAAKKVIPAPPALQHVPATHRFYLPPSELASSSAIKPIATCIVSELGCSSSFTFPNSGDASPLSRWRKLFVLLTQSLVPDNPTHVSLYPRLVKRMQQRRQENSCEPFLPKARHVARVEHLFREVIALQATKEEGKKRPKGNLRAKKNKEEAVKKTIQISQRSEEETNRTMKLKSTTHTHIYFDVGEDGRFFYRRQWRERDWVAPTGLPLCSAGSLHAPNPHKLRLRQVLADEERRVSRERGVLLKQSRALRISQRALASKVRLINQVETRADEDKESSILPLCLLLPHFDASVIREVRGLKEPRLTDTVRLCGKAVMILLGEGDLDKYQPLSWWWTLLQSVFAVESQLLYRLGNVVPERVRKRQWNKIKDFLECPAYSIDGATVPHEKWAEEALEGTRPRGAITLLARWINCVYHQYFVNKRLELDVYPYIDDLHDEYKQLSDTVTEQEQRVALLQTGVGYLKKNVSDKIREYSSMSDTSQRVVADSAAPLPKPYSDYLSALRRCSLMQGMPMEVLQELALNAKVVKYEKRSGVQDTGCFFLLITGRLQLVQAIEMSQRSLLRSRRVSEATTESFTSHHQTVIFEPEPSPRDSPQSMRKRSAKSICSLGTGTEMSTESVDGVSVLHAGQWLFDASFISKLEGQPHTADMEIGASSLGAPRGRPALLLQVNPKALAESIKPSLLEVLKANRKMVLDRARKILFLQQLPFLAGVGSEVVLSVALSTEEVQHPPEELIIDSGQVIDCLYIVTGGGVNIDGVASGSAFFPTPEDVLCGCRSESAVYASEYGCGLLMLPSAKMYNLCSTFASLKTRLACHVEERAEDIALLTNPSSYPWSDLNEEFQLLISHTPVSKADAADTQQSLMNLKKTFINMTTPLVEMVVSEIHKDPATKILPALFNAQHTPAVGGHRYIINGVLIEAASNKGNIYGSIDNAVKSLKHELRAWEQILATGAKGIAVPLCMLVSYRGYRVKVMPVLPIGGRCDVIHGGSDGNGGNIKQKESPEVSAVLKEICTMLNIKGHRLPGGGRPFYGPADLEVRKGTDGRYYILLPGRLFPSTYVRPTAHDQGQWLVQLMRPEAVIGSRKALSSDAFSRWGVDKCDDLDVVAECRRVNAEVMPRFAARLDEMFREYEVPVFEELEGDEMSTPFTTVCDTAHAMGINIRSFAAAIALLPPTATTPCRLLHIEMTARTFKTTLAQSLRTITNPTTEAVEAQTTRLLSSLFGKGPSNTAFWRDVLYPNCKRKFGFASLEAYFSNIPTMHMTTAGVCRVEYVGFTEGVVKVKENPDWHMVMLARVCSLCGLKMSLNDAKGHYDKLVEVARTTGGWEVTSKKRASSRFSLGSNSSKRKGRGGESSTESIPFHFLDGITPIIRAIHIPPPDPATTHAARGRLDLAVQHLTRRIDAMKTTVGPDHGSLIKPYVTLASIHREWGHTTLEGRYLQQALDICTRDLPFDDVASQRLHSFDEASIMTQLACHVKHHCLGKAAYLLYQARSILIELGFKSTNKTLLKCLKELGEVEEAQLNHDKAYEAYAEVEDDVEAVLGVVKALLGKFELEKCEEMLRGMGKVEGKMLQKVRHVQWLVADLKGEDEAVLKLLEEGEAAWDWALCVKGKELFEAMCILRGVVAKLQEATADAASASARVLSRFEYLLSRVQSAMPESTQFFSSTPPSPPDLLPLLGDPTLPTARKRLIAVILKEHHIKQSEFEELESLLETAVPEGLY